MKRLWQRYAEKIDAASLRERVMIFAAAAAVLIALANALLIDPQLAKQRRFSREAAQRQTEVKALQAQLENLARARAAGPDQAEQRRLEETKKRIAEVEARLAEEQRKFVAPDRIGAVLEEMLSRNRKLQLVDMRTLPATALGGGEAGAEKPPAGKPAAKPKAPAAGAGQIYRHGVELTVSGTYLDLLAYLKDLESLPSQMYWGKLDLSVAVYPQVTLKLSVYTLSLDIAWMVV